MKALGLVFVVASLLAAGIASAGSVVAITEKNLGSYKYATGNGTGEITSTSSATGTASTLSLKLVWPVTTDKSGVSVTNLASPTVSSITGFSYWVKAALNRNAHLTMYLDTDEDGIWDTYVRDARYNTGNGNAWLKLDSSGTMDFYTKKTGIVEQEFVGTWAQFQATYSNAVVKEIRISNDGFSEAGTNYLDDFTFGNTIYRFVPDTNPATVVMLF